MQARLDHRRGATKTIAVAYRAAMSVASMLGFRRRSNWQHRRREDLQKNPRGEEK
jgi:hypothetical protein